MLKYRRDAGGWLYGQYYQHLSKRPMGGLRSSHRQKSRTNPTPNDVGPGHVEPPRIKGSGGTEFRQAGRGGANNMREAEVPKWASGRPLGTTPNEPWGAVKHRQFVGSKSPVDLRDSFSYNPLEKETGCIGWS